MLDPYRRVLSYPGTAAFSASALLGRLPIAMVGLGIVLLVQEETGSYGLAGAVSAVALLANGVGSLVQGRLFDRVGQSRVFGPLTLVWGVSLAGLMWVVEAGLSMALVYFLAAVSGAFLPSLGTCVRARWSHALSDPAEVQTAYALESVLDEVLFITGPILVTLLATAIDPVIGLGAALVAGTVGTLALSRQRDSEPPAHPKQPEVRAEPMPWVTVIPLTVVSASMGVLFGSLEVTTVAFSDERGVKSLAGLLLALYALGSLVAGVAAGLIAWRVSTLTRLRFGAAGIAVASAPLSLIEPVWAMGAVLLLAGVAIAPTLIATMSLCEQTLHRSRLTEGMAFVHTGIVAGVAPGAAAAGAIVDARGASAAYLVCLAGGLSAFAASLLTRVPTTTLTPHDAMA